jgi:hypothetical protein
MAQQRRRKREATSMALAAPDLEETKVEQGEGKRGKGKGDGVFQLVAKLVVESTGSEQQKLGLFIGQPCWF